MLRSMFSGVSGLRSHQTMMDVVGNNIANVNTAGYKSSSVVFADTLSQLTKAAGAPQDGNGGTNPSQVGLGVRVDAIAQNMSQGSAQATGKATDLMLQGDGMFVVQQGDATFYTRAGSFSLDSNGSIVTPDGAYVQGWRADATGAVNTNSAIAPLVIPSDAVMPAAVTTTSAIKGNIDKTFKPTNSTSTTPGTTDGNAITTSFTSYDAQGVAKKVNLTFTNQVTVTAPVAPATTPTYAPTNTWKVAATDDKGVTLALSAPTVDFGTTGKSATPLNFTASVNGTNDVKIDLSGLSAYVSTTGTSAVNSVPDGSPIGTLTAFNFGTDGVITGNYSNGLKRTLGQVAIATFNNYAGLRKEGNSMYSVSTNSGNPVVGVAGQGGRGGMLAGSLEMSNVDLSAEFTNLILAQRGFQANSKVITASDEILQDLVNLKR